MSYSALKKLKKQVEETASVHRMAHVVVGHDLSSVIAYKILKDQGASVQLVMLSGSDLDTLCWTGPSAYRGPLKANMPLTEGINTFERTGLFYKDQKFRPFGGRARPETLLTGESFYSQKGLSVSLEDLIRGLYGDFSLKELLQDAIMSPLPKITLLEKGFRLSVGPNKEIECEQLYWSPGPYAFLSQVQNKDLLSNNAIEFCERRRPKASLCLRMNFKRPITDKKETLFLPLSFTHDWGHFIGEFNHLDDGLQAAHFVHYFDLEDDNEEQIGKKLRLFKKNLEKIFPKFSTELSSEYVKINEFGQGQEVDDQSLPKLSAQDKMPFWLGVHCPFDDSEITVKGDENDSIIGPWQRILYGLEQLNFSKI